MERGGLLRIMFVDMFDEDLSDVSVHSGENQIYGFYRSGEMFDNVPGDPANLWLQPWRLCPCQCSIPQVPQLIYRVFFFFTGTPLKS